MTLDAEPEEATAADDGALPAPVPAEDDDTAAEGRGTGGGGGGAKYRIASLWEATRFEHSSQTQQREHLPRRQYAVERQPAAAQSCVALHILVLAIAPMVLLAAALRFAS